MGNHGGVGFCILLRSLWISLCGCLSDIYANIWKCLRKFLFYILSFGPMPLHVSFIMDGNRRFAHRQNLKSDAGHENGFSALKSILQYCYEMGVKYVTVYAFSIDNFKRTRDEVQSIMNLMQDKIEELLKQESIVNRYQVRINFWGNLRLLSEPVRLAAEKAMKATAHNTGPVLSVCVAYTSSDEILHAVQESCQLKWDIASKEDWNFSKGRDDDTASGEDDWKDLISVADMERHLFTAACPDPDILIRTSGETRLSNFLLWQTTFCHLQNPDVLWPEFSIWDLVWAILEYQRAHQYLMMGRSDALQRKHLGR